MQVPKEADTVSLKVTGLSLFGMTAMSCECCADILFPEGKYGHLPVAVWGSGQAELLWPGCEDVPSR